MSSSRLVPRLHSHDRMSYVRQPPRRLLGAPRHTAGAPAPSIHSLLERVRQLELENRQLKVTIVTGLRIAIGTLKDSERNAEIETMLDQSRFPDEALEILRSSLVRSLQKLTGESATSIRQPDKPSSTPGGYIA
jgi:hypothetical protein